MLGSKIILDFLYYFHLMSIYLDKFKVLLDKEMNVVAASRFKLSMLQYFRITIIWRHC